MQRKGRAVWRGKARHHRLADQERPDLILMGVVMPGLNALDATQRILEHLALRETPIAAVSAPQGAQSLT